MIETMSSKKKRNKKYQGSVANARPTITKVSAVKRHPVHQWWLDKRRIAKPVGIAAAVGVGLIIVIIGAIDLIW